MSRRFLKSRSAIARPQLFREDGRRILKALTLPVITGLLLTVSLSGQSYNRAKRQQGGEDFFIVSSVDAAKKQLLLKHPTEVTEVVQATGETVFVDEHGKRINFNELHAGDTIFLTSSRTPDNAPRIAIRIRKGPMTLDELRRRYHSR
jgi:hypothetical protein